MNVISEDISNLVYKELKSANEKFPLFVSMHEAYAVMLEELEEAREEMLEAERNLQFMWNSTRRNCENHAQQFCVRVQVCAERLAVEACQLAAMARKAIMSAEAQKGNEEDE